MDANHQPAADGADTNPTTEMPAAGAPVDDTSRTEAMNVPNEDAPRNGDTEVLPAVVPATSPDESTAVPPGEPTALVPAGEETAVEPVPPPDAEAPPDQPAGTEPAAAPTPSFLTRGRMRRRLRYVRRAREVALRDLGGLVFDLHRFGRDRGDLVDQKLTALRALDAEMRALSQALDAADDVTVLREPGLAGCPRCGALHASDARFCSTCGLPVGKGASLPAGPTFAGPAPGPAAPAAPEPPAGGEAPAQEP